MGKGECCFGFGERLCQFISSDLLEAYEVHGRKGSRKDSKYPRRIFVGETLGPWRERYGPTGNRLGKGPIESGMIVDGSDTIPAMYQCKGLS